MSALFLNSTVIYLKILHITLLHPYLSSGRAVPKQLCHQFGQTIHLINKKSNLTNRHLIFVPIDGHVHISV